MEGAVVTPVVQAMKPRHRRATGLAQGRRASEWQVRLRDEADVIAPTSVSIPHSARDRAVFLQGPAPASAARQSRGLGLWFQVFNEHTCDLGKHYFSSVSFHIPICQMGG